MKKLLLIAAMALTAASIAMSLPDAKAKIPEVVANPAKMAEIMGELTTTNQVQFLSAVNEAISQMPGSVDEKTALFLSVNEAALKAHGEGNLAALLGATFATVPPESLTVLNERFAETLFNRNADPANPMSASEYIAVAKDAMDTIADATSKTDDSAVRTTMAALMFINGAGDMPQDSSSELRETLLESVDESVRDNAQEWIRAALGENENGEKTGQKSYDSILGASDTASGSTTPTKESTDAAAVAAAEAAATSPDTATESAGAGPEPVDNILIVSSSEGLASLLADLASGDTTTQIGGTPGAFVQATDYSIDTIGVSDSTTTGSGSTSSESEAAVEAEVEGEVEPVPEVIGYDFQTIE